jgi:L-serine dehydratase
MFLSVFDIFKIGVGPSSSHTMGPMLAAARFLDVLRAGKGRVPGSGAPVRVEASLHGSLAFTGKGHATDRAVVLGLLGYRPETLDAEEAERREAILKATGRIDVPGLGSLAFDRDKDIVFDYGPPLPGHANGIVLRSFDAAGKLLTAETYYSIGGGFVLTESQLGDASLKGDDAEVTRPYPFATAAEMLAMGESAGLGIAAMKRANETAGGHSTLDADLDRLWAVMDGCIDRGLAAEGTLPGASTFAAVPEPSIRRCSQSAVATPFSRIPSTIGSRSTRWR